MGGRGVNRIPSGLRPPDAERGHPVKIVVYTDGKPPAAAALRFAAVVSERLSAEMGVLTVRPGTHGTESPPPLGVALPREGWSALPQGIQILTGAVEVLAGIGFLSSPPTIKIREVPSGYLFVASTSADQKVPFFEHYGNLIDVLNEEVAEHRYDLVVIASPPRDRVGRFLQGDTARRLALNLHTSLLVVRKGELDSRFLVCADGSPSARRLFPLLKQILPAIRGPLDVMFVQRPGTPKEEVDVGNQCVEKARAWLDVCGKPGELLRPEGKRPEKVIIDEAGDRSVVVMGATLRHDLHHRMKGSLPLQVLSETESTMLLVKLPPEADLDFFKEPMTC
jgi:nucleotide-binding universal stress UspA family protein